MLNKLSLSVIGLVAVMTVNAQAQSPAAKPAEVALTKMQVLHFMVGTWQGQAWRMLPNGQKESYKQVETVTTSLDGQCLQVVGKGYNDKGEQTHDAVGMLYFDVMAGRYGFLAIEKKGYTSHSNPEVKEKGFVWKLKLPHGQMRYTFQLNADGDWHEVGEFSRDGQQWMPMLEMLLKRVK